MGNGLERDYADDTNSDLEIAEWAYFRDHPDEAPELDYGHDFDPAEEFAGPDQGDLDWAASHPARADLACSEGERSPFEEGLMTAAEFADYAYHERLPDPWGNPRPSPLDTPDGRDQTGALDGHPA